MKQAKFGIETHSCGLEAVYEGSRISYRPESTGNPYYVRDLDGGFDRCNFRSIQQACRYLDKAADKYLFIKTNSYGAVSYFRCYDYPGCGCESVKIDEKEFKALLNLGWEYRE